MPDQAKDQIPTAVRRRRYIPAPSRDSPVSLTPVKLRMLQYLAELRFLSLPQLARLCCPAERRDLGEKSARRHLRALFDLGLVDALPVSRLALAGLNAPNDETLLYGSAPNVYVLTPKALETLRQAGLIEEEFIKRPMVKYGPKNGLFLAHELAVRDVRVWLERCARHHGGDHAVLVWRDGPGAAMELSQERFPQRVLPDAWFVYRLRDGETPTVLVGLIEADRGTERGDRRWREKLEAYGALYAGAALREVTGYVNARVLVLCPDARRRDGLAGLILREAEPALASRFWLAGRDVLARDALRAPLWRRPGSPALLPLANM